MTDVPPKATTALMTAKSGRLGQVLQSEMKETRLPELDGIRGCAILLVLIWHYVPCEISASEGAAHVVSRALGLTWSGVDLFFVLSGFLIAGILLDNRNASNYFRVFYIRRVCRTFPLYFLLVGIFVSLT